MCFFFSVFLSPVFPIPSYYSYSFEYSSLSSRQSGECDCRRGCFSFQVINHRGFFFCPNRQVAYQSQEPVSRALASFLYIDFQSERCLPIAWKQLFEVTGLLSFLGNCLAHSFWTIPNNLKFEVCWRMWALGSLYFYFFFILRHSSHVASESLSKRWLTSRTACWKQQLFTSVFKVDRCFRCVKQSLLNKVIPACQFLLHLLYNGGIYNWYWYFTFMDLDIF